MDRSSIPSLDGDARCESLRIKPRQGSRGNAAAYDATAGGRERGAALAVVALTAFVLAALGIGLLVLGAVDSDGARDSLRTRQAELAAESGLALVKHWFDAPAGSAGSWLVPTAGDVDRSRRRVDPDGDGTSEPFAAAQAPWNVIYRQGTNDLFERPFRAAPSLALLGDAAGPDLVIDDENPAAAVRDFLAGMNRELFPARSVRDIVTRLRRISVFAPPTVRGGGSAFRTGIATVEVQADVIRVLDGAEETLATARATGVLQEIPYAAPGPAVAGRDLTGGAALDLRWGTVLVARDADLGAAAAAVVPHGWPWVAAGRRLVPDANGDGTIDDADGDGAGDFDEWQALPGSLADPWFRLLTGGSVRGAPAGVWHPYPFDPALVPDLWSLTDDASSIFQRSSIAASARPDMSVFRAAAIDGGPGVHLFRYVPGTTPPLFREGGLPVRSFEDATRGTTGLFYFDTADGLSPADRDGDGTLDNLTPSIVLGDPAWRSSGVIVVNAVSFTLAEMEPDHFVRVAPPGEPFDDADGDGTCASGEIFMRLLYPLNPASPGASFGRQGILTCAGGRVPERSGPSAETALTYEGLLLTSWRLVLGGGLRVFGAVVAAGDLEGRSGSAAGRPPAQVLFDSRLAQDAWPPAGMRVPRTVWQRRSVH
jgi:hypothetical protein